jgi:hypothetical protein
MRKHPSLLNKNLLSITQHYLFQKEIEMQDGESDFLTPSLQEVW